jgi:hypothetical protein
VKFADIKVGDTVLSAKSYRVPRTWDERREFWIPAPVTRVTPKRFVVEGVMFSKERGQAVGVSGEVFREGDHPKWRKNAVSDQTAERDAFLRRCEIVEAIDDLVTNLAEVKSVDHPRLEEIHALLAEAARLSTETKA